MEKTCRSRRPISFSFFSAVAALVLCLCVLANAAEAAQIRVGIVTGAKSATISGHGVKATAGRSHFTPPSNFTVSARGSRVIVHGKSYASPVILRSSQPIQCGSTGYEGEIILRAQDGALTVVNVLDVEKYLRGVLGHEISPKWALEAIKAQAVISRTYALSQMGRHNSQGYDVCALDHCQVYRGVNVHSQSTDAAISQTRGLVVTYNGQLAHTYFCSDSGGATSDVSDVWGKPEAYLVVRREPFPSQSPKAEWEVTLTAAEIQSALAKKGKGVGSLRRIDIVQRDSAGRPTVLKFTGSGGTSVVPSATFRTLVGATKVRSTFFEFSRSAAPQSLQQASEPSRPEPAKRRETRRSRRRARSRARAARKPARTSPDSGQPGAEEDEHLSALAVQRKLTLDERLDMLLHPERKQMYLDRARGVSGGARADAPAPGFSAPAPREDFGGGPLRPAGPSSVAVRGTITLYGRGWGHGVGLSQWGAKAMADHGWTAQKILGFYYPGTVIQRR